LKNMKDSLQTLYKILPFVVTAVLVSFLIKKIGIEKLALIPNQISLKYLFWAILLDIPFIFLKSYKWKRVALVSFPEMRYRDSVSSFLIGIGASLFTPARLGELARAAAFKHNKTSAIALAFTDKLIDATGLGLLFSLSAYLYNWKIGIAVFSAITFLIAFLCIYVYRRKDSKIICHLPFFSHLLKAKGAMRKLRPSLLLSSLFLSIICFFILMLQFYVILSGFADVSFMSVLIGLPIILVGSMLPVSIAGLGLREMIASVVMRRFFISSAQAITASFLLFVTNGFLPGVVGIGVGAGKIRSFWAKKNPKPP